MARLSQTTLAQVDDYVITVSEFKDRFYKLPSATQQVYSRFRDRRAYLDLYIDEQLPFLIAKKMGLEKSDLYRSVMSPRHRIKPWPGKSRWALEQILDLNLRANELAISDSEIRRYYDFYKDEYKSAFEVRITHFYMYSDHDYSYAQSRLAKGASLESIAEEMKKKGLSVKLKTLKRPQLVLRQSPAAIQSFLWMKAGQLSYSAINGEYVISRLDSIQPLTRERASPHIRAILYQDKRKLWMNEQKKQFNIQVNGKLLASLDLQPA